MGFEYLTESSTLEVLDVHTGDPSVDVKQIIDDERLRYSIQNFQAPTQFHIGMLTISLISGLAYGGYVTYNCWREKNVFLTHVRNLVIALICRTFFTILFDGIIILESPLNVGGGSTLLSFECISLNLVLAFWLTFNIYIHERVQRNFNSEPSLKLYMYGVPGVAVYFALVWIFAMEGTLSGQVWWLWHYKTPFCQWVVDSVRLLFLLVQLALLADIGRMMMVKSSDNDTVSLMRKVALMMGILVLLFWLQFGLSVGRPADNNPQPYLYFYYFIDGTQCGFVCLVLFFFTKWVPMILDKIQNIIMENGEMAGRGTRSKNEVLLTGAGGGGIVTIDFLFTTHERRTDANVDGRGDIVYSSIVQPETLQKTIDLYKRLNVLPTDNVTIVEGEEFYDCRLRNDSKKSETKQTSEHNKKGEKIVKKNAFYSSKYLIVDPKNKDIPRYLETRPSVSSGERTPKEDSKFETLGADELVEQWLRSHSEDMGDVREKRKKTNGEKVSPLDEYRPSVTDTIVSTVNSVILGTSLTPENPSALDTNIISKSSEALDKCGIITPSDQIENEKNHKQELFDFKLTDDPSSRKNIKIKKNKEKMQENAETNNKKPESSQEDRKQNIKNQTAGNANTLIMQELTDTQTAEVATGKSDDTRSEYSSSPLQSVLEEAFPSESRLSIPQSDIYITPQTTPDIEKSFDKKASDLKAPETRDNSQTANITYSELLAFRSLRGQPGNEKPGGFSLTSAVFSTFNAAINYGAGFFRSKN